MAATPASAGRLAAACEPIAQYGPFVMNTPAEIEQRLADDRDGRLGTSPLRSSLLHRQLPYRLPLRHRAGSPNPRVVDGLARFGKRAS